MRQRIQEVYDDNVIVKRPVNAGISQSLGGEFTLSNKIMDWWSFDLGLNLFYYKVEGDSLVSVLIKKTLHTEEDCPIVLS